MKEQQKQILKADRLIYDQGYMAGKMAAVDEKKYNGYTNYETWAVALWIDNDEASQKHWQIEATDCLNGSKTSFFNDGTIFMTLEENAEVELGNRLKENIAYTNNPLIDGSGLYIDLLGAALSEVNWYEIAQNLIKSAK